MKKTFDAVKMVRDIRDKLYKKTKNRTDKEKMEFHRKQAQELYAELSYKKPRARRHLKNALKSVS